MQSQSGGKDDTAMQANIPVAMGTRGFQNSAAIARGRIEQQISSAAAPSPMEGPPTCKIGWLL